MRFFGMPHLVTYCVQVSEEVLFSQWLPSSPFPLHPIVGVLFSSRWKEKSENCLSDFRSQCLQYFEDCSVFFFNFDNNN